MLNQKKNQNTYKKENSYCIVCEKNKQTTATNKNIKAVALENKISQQKSKRLDCTSIKLTFLK